MVFSVKKFLSRRDEVSEFALMMESKLQNAGHRWIHCSKDFLAMEFMRVSCELLASLGIEPLDMVQMVMDKAKKLREKDYDSDPSLEAADSANFAMMIADNTKNGRF